MQKNYWAIHMGKGSIFVDVAYQNGFIGVGWDELGKSLEEFQGLNRKEFFKEVNPAMKKAYPDKSQNQRGAYIGQLFRFASLMKIGDIVLMPKSDEGKIYIGTIDSDYFYLEKPTDSCNFKHRRKVNWIKAVNASDISQKLRYSTGAIMTVFSVSDHAQEIDTLIAGGLEKMETEDLEQFALESHLEDFLVENWNKTRLGKEYSVIKEGSELIGKQYVTKIGRIDILAKSKDGKRWLVIELKKGKSSDDVVGQTLRYMAWVKENEAKEDEKVEGLIITSEKEEKLVYALKMVNNVKLMTYTVNFKLSE